MQADGALAGRVAAITGAAGDIGLAIARRFRLSGCRLLLLDLDEGQLGTRADAAGLADALVRRCDVTDAEACRDGVAAALGRFGRLDILVNNAAARTPPASAAEFPVELWREAIDVNLTGAFLMCRAALGPMRAAGRGVIINVASQLGHVTTPGRAAYSASKAGMISLARTIALDHAAEGIRAVSLSPGAVMTGRLEQQMGSRAAALEMLGPSYPAGRLGTADDVAAAALFLASDAAAFVNGSDMLVDGGYTAR